MKYIGIDLHSNKFNICIVHDDNTRKFLSFGLTVRDINDFLNYVDKETYIMVEASTNTFRFVERIEDQYRLLKFPHFCLDKMYLLLLWFYTKKR